MMEFAALFVVVFGSIGLAGAVGSWLLNFQWFEDLMSRGVPPQQPELRPRREVTQPEGERYGDVWMSE